MRIVGGRLRGRNLAGPPPGTRPTSDRVREAIFNVLAHGFGDPVPGARVLDIFAGTGALGIEALSRGAAFALFVDDANEARATIRQNVEALGLGGASRVFRRDATRIGRAAPSEPFGLVFCDPPYGRDLTGPALASLVEGGWLRDGALAVLEESAPAGLDLPAGFAAEDTRTYGGARVTFARYLQGGPVTTR